MTEWLIHFTRDSAQATARDLLLTILTEGVLRPGFGMRGNPPRRTVYGQIPAVCFSEQPIASLLDYIRERADNRQTSGYGILIHKHDAYAAGGLPVIYGLQNVSEDESTRQNSGTDGLRRLDEGCLSAEEQFRYVTFAPTRSPHPIDWTHEREWRWPADSSHAAGNSLFYLGGLYGSSKMGMFEGRVHAFVYYDKDVEWLRSKLRQADKESRIGKVPWRLDYSEVWRNHHLCKMDVLSLETAERELGNGNTNFARLEDWPSDRRPKLFK